MTYPRNYTTKGAAVAAVRKQGLQNVPHTIDLVSRTWEPHFTPDLVEDVEEIKSRGFRATLAASVEGKTA